MVLCYKSIMRTRLIVLLLFMGQSLYAQSNMVEAFKYELTDNIKKVRATLFYSDSRAINRVTDMIFKDGHILSLIENYPEAKVKKSYTYSYQKNKETYTLAFKHFYDQQKILDSTSLFRLVTFQDLKFYYPDYGFALQQRKYPESIDITYSIYGKKYQTILKLKKDHSITETNNFEDFRVQNFNKKGHIVSQEFSNRYLNKYTYNKNGALISDLLYQNLMKRSQDPPIKTIYFYENDSKGNWVKKVTITLDRREKISESSFITFETRELTYTDGFKSGSSHYDESFIKKTTEKYKQ